MGSKLTDYMKALVAYNTVGFVATVDEDGTPNLSPKGTCVVLDDRHIAFGEIRSPNTIRNLKLRPSMEINFIDLFSRKGFRAKGQATFIERGTSEFEELIGNFSQWGELTEKINGVVKLKVERTQVLISPAYDIGAQEEELRTKWTTYFSNTQPKHRA